MRRAAPSIVADGALSASEAAPRNPGVPDRRASSAAASTSKLSPMPIAALGSSPSDASTATPASFLPPSSTSLGQRRRGSAPSILTASCTASEAAAGMSDGCRARDTCDLENADIHRPPSGDSHARPDLPRPRVCLEAKTAAPSAPIRAASSCVDEHTSKYLAALPTEPGRLPSETSHGSGRSGDERTRPPSISYPRLLSLPISMSAARLPPQIPSISGRPTGPPRSAAASLAGTSSEGPSII